MSFFRHRQTVSEEIEELLDKLENIGKIPPNWFWHRDKLNELVEFEKLLAKDIPDLKKIDHDYLISHPEQGKIPIVQRYHKLVQLLREKRQALENLTARVESMEGKISSYEQYAEAQRINNIIESLDKYILPDILKFVSHLQEKHYPTKEERRALLERWGFHFDWPAHVELGERLIENWFFVENLKKNCKSRELKEVLSSWLPDMDFNRGGNILKKINYNFGFLNQLIDRCPNRCEDLFAFISEDGIASLFGRIDYAKVGSYIIFFMQNFNHKQLSEYFECEHFLDPEVYQKLDYDVDFLKELIIKWPKKERDVLFYILPSFSRLELMGKAEKKELIESLLIFNRSIPTDVLVGLFYRWIDAPFFERIEYDFEFLNSLLRECHQKKVEEFITFFDYVTANVTSNIFMFDVKVPYKKGGEFCLFIVNRFPKKNLKELIIHFFRGGFLVNYSNKYDLEVLKELIQRCPEDKLHSFLGAYVHYFGRDIISLDNKILSDFLLDLVQRFPENRITEFRFVLESSGGLFIKFDNEDVAKFIISLAENLPKKKFRVIYRDALEICEEARLFEKFGLGVVYNFLRGLADNLSVSKLEGVFSEALLICDKADLFDSLGVEATQAFLIKTAKKFSTDELFHIFSSGFSTAYDAGLFDPKNLDNLIDLFYRFKKKFKEKFSEVFPVLFSYAKVEIFQKMGNKEFVDFLLDYTKKCPRPRISVLIAFLHNLSAILNQTEDLDDIISIINKNMDIVTHKIFLQFAGEIHSIKQLNGVFNTFRFNLKNNLLDTIQELNSLGLLCGHVTNAFFGGAAGEHEVKKGPFANIVKDVTNLFEFNPSVSVVNPKTKSKFVVTKRGGIDGSIGVIYDYGYIYESYAKDAGTRDVVGEKSKKRYRTGHKSSRTPTFFVVNQHSGTSRYNELLIRKWTVSDIFYTKGCQDWVINRLRWLCYLLSSNVSGRDYINGAYWYRKTKLGGRKYKKKYFNLYEVDNDEVTWKVVYDPLKGKPDNDDQKKEAQALITELLKKDEEDTKVA